MIISWALTIFWALWSAYLGGQLYYNITSGTVWAIVLYSFLIALSVVGTILATKTHYHRGAADAYAEMRRIMQAEIDKQKENKTEK
jgi:hypothetical protein